MTGLVLALLLGSVRAGLFLDDYVLLAILSGPSESLPQDRLERKTRLLEMLQDGRPESLCQVIRDLSAYQNQKVGTMNDNDHMILKQSRNMLLGEWGFVLSITRAQAELNLHHLLTHAVAA